MGSFTMGVALVAAAFATGASAGGTHRGGHHADMMAIGAPGSDQPTRTVEISMRETDDGAMIFEPGDLSFAAGETVRLLIVNEGDNEHEFVMDTPDSIREHMALMERFPEMEHDEPNAIRLEPGERGEILWTFVNAGSFEFACLLYGHYDAGMHGPLTVN